VKVSELVTAVTAVLGTSPVTLTFRALTMVVDLRESAYILPENSSPKSLTPV
jgi:hypothetical protein